MIAKILILFFLLVSTIKSESVTNEGLEQVDENKKVYWYIGNSTLFFGGITNILNSTVLGFDLFRKRGIGVSYSLIFNRLAYGYPINIYFNNITEEDIYNAILFNKRPPSLFAMGAIGHNIAILRHFNNFYIGPTIYMIFNFARRHKIAEIHYMNRFGYLFIKHLAVEVDILGYSYINDISVGNSSALIGYLYLGGFINIKYYF